MLIECPLAILSVPKRLQSVLECPHARWSVPERPIAIPSIPKRTRAYPSIPERPGASQSLSSARSCRTKHSSYICMHCPECEQCLTYSIKTEVLSEFCDTRYDRIHVINDNDARNRIWNEKHKFICIYIYIYIYIYRERCPNTRQLRTDWTLKRNSSKFHQCV